MFSLSIYPIGRLEFLKQWFIFGVMFSTLWGIVGILLQTSLPKEYGQYVMYAGSFVVYLSTLFVVARRLKDVGLSRLASAFWMCLSVVLPIVDLVLLLKHPEFGSIVKGILMFTIYMFKYGKFDISSIATFLGGANVFGIVHTIFWVLFLRLLFLKSGHYEDVEA